MMRSNWPGPQRARIEPSLRVCVSLWASLYIGLIAALTQLPQTAQATQDAIVPASHAYFPSFWSQYLPSNLIFLRTPDGLAATMIKHDLRDDRADEAEVKDDPYAIMAPRPVRTSRLYRQRRLLPAENNFQQALQLRRLQGRGGFPAAENNFQLRVRRAPTGSSYADNFQLRIRKQFPNLERNFQLRVRKSLADRVRKEFPQAERNFQLRVRKTFPEAERNFQLRVRKDLPMRAERNFQLRVRKDGRESGLSWENSLPSIAEQQFQLRVRKALEDPYGMTRFGPEYDDEEPELDLDKRAEVEEDVGEEVGSHDGLGDDE